MLDIKFIRENSKKVKQGAENKGIKIDIDKILKLDEKRRSLIQDIEELKAEKNKLGVENRGKGREIKNKIKDLEPNLKEVEKEFNKLMFEIPNIPLDDVPIGKNEKDNKIIRKVGSIKKGGRDYLEIAEKLDIIDVKRASKISGTRFGYLKKEAVLLELGLIQLAFDVLRKNKFVPIIPPAIIKPEMMKAMGYIERGKDEIYQIKKDDLYLIGTAEQAIGPMHANEIFNEKDLPKRYVGFSPCFRREAGSYGKDTKGILRVHQFDKVEMFSFCKPENSAKEHKLFLYLEEKLMKLLKIPYRVVQICTGDLGDPAASKFDIESWMSGQNKYRETHSASNCTDFQARRLKIRYRETRNKKPVLPAGRPALPAGRQETRFVHTVNGTAFAIGRILITIIENYQQKDGSIKVPKILQKYTKLKNIK